MVNYQGASLEEQVKILLEQNLEYSKEIYKIMKKTQRYILMGRVMSIIYVILIVAPLILGVMFLPSFLKTSLGNIAPGAFGTSASLEDLLGDKNINQDDLLKAVQNQGGLFEAYKNILNLQKDQ